MAEGLGDVEVQEVRDSLERDVAGLFERSIGFVPVPLPCDPSLEVISDRLGQTVFQADEAVTIMDSEGVVEDSGIINWED